MVGAPTIKLETVSFPLKEPFVITGHTFTSTDTVRVTLEKDGIIGRGEAIGSYYLDETADSMLSQLTSVLPELEAGLDRDKIQDVLPSCGARNALDCAYWDLAAKLAGRRVWQMLDLEVKPLTTVCTIGIGTAHYMADKASAYQAFPNLKIKLDNDQPIEKLEAIRRARPDANLIIDVNQGWSFEELKEYAPQCAKLEIAMIEQPLARGGDDVLAGYSSPVPLGADESCLSLAEYADAANKYDVINIKLDKCGGLTEGLAIADRAQRDGKGLMVGNMTGSSLSMAPSFIVGQLCAFVDIDGPLLIAQDIKYGLDFQEGGLVNPPSPELWG